MKECNNHLYVVGNGLISNAFKRASINFEHTIFASGVSNSQLNVASEFKREFSLLKKEADNNNIIYFSTCSIFDKTKINTAYVEHKKNMEDYLLSLSRDNIIVRLPQVVGNGGSQLNLFNYVKNAIRSSSPLYIEKWTRRNIIDIDIIPNIVREIVNGKTNKSVFNIAAPEYILVNDLVQLIADNLNVRAIVELSDIDSSYEIPTDVIKLCISGYDSYFYNDYYPTLVRKYAL